MPAPPFGGAQQTMDSQQLPSLWLSSQQANLNSSTQQGVASLQSISPLQLPAHVQQWLATLAHDAQQASGSITVLDQPASRERHAQASASSPGQAAASAEAQEDLRQMKAELADVKARFAETQAALEETQQQLLIIDDRRYSLPVRARSPERADTVSPQRLRAMQETVQDLHAEIAGLRDTVYQKDAELDTLHRSQDQKGSELQAALWQVTSEAGKASRAQTDLIVCREACKSLEEQLAEAHRKLQHVAGEHHLLEGVIANGRQENASLRSSCSCLQDELAHVKAQFQDTINQAKGAERTASAREAEADALCKENSGLKQQLFSMQQDCIRSRGAYHAVTAELTEVRGSIRQMQKANASAPPPLYYAGQSMYGSAGQQPEGQGSFVDLHPSSESAPSCPDHRTQKSQAWPVAPAEQPAAGARNDAGLIKAIRQTGRSSLSNSMQTPWGQPEPATRDLIPKAGSPWRQAQPVSSQDGTAAANRYASSRDALNRDAAVSRGSAYGASAADDRPPNSSWDADSWHRHAAQHNQRSSSLAVPTANSRHIGNRASSQQVKQQSSAPAQQMGSRHDYDGSGLPAHLQARETSEHHSLDLEPGTGQGSGQVAAGPTDNERPQHQEHQHRFCNQTANDSRWPAEGPVDRQARDSVRPAAKPYATDQSLQAMIRDSQGLEGKLMKLNQEKAELEAEYARMPSHSGRNLKERKRKTDVECRFEVLDQDVNSIRLQLKKLGLK
ncbi:TPA: hypothetical protein ACH3X1_003818 [Trebouxia sp. C0004]